MRKFYLLLILLFSIGALLLLPQVSLAAVHHTGAQQKSQQGTYSFGTDYYSFSSIATTGSTAGTIGAVNQEGGLTLYVNADGTFTGKITSNPHSVYGVTGSFQSDGSIQLTILLGRGISWQGTAQPQENGEFIGTFAVTNLYVTTRTGNWAIAPVQDPTQVTAFDVSAFIAAGTDQGTPYGGVVILDQSGITGTFLMQDGGVVPVTAQITPDTVTFTFLWDNLQPVSVIGTPSNVSSSAGSIVKYAGTFVGPQPDDSGNWTGYPFTFVP